MASYRSTSAVNPTSGIAIVDTVTLDTIHSEVQVVNVSGASVLYVRVTPAGAPTDPTVKGDECVPVPASIGAFVQLFAGASGTPTVVKVISAAATDYSVQGGDL